QRPRAGEALDGLDLAPVDLHREEQARPYGCPVHPNGARAADAVLAADVCSGQPQPVAQEVGEQQTWLDSVTNAAPVDGQLDVHARLSARSTRTPVRWRR